MAFPCSFGADQSRKHFGKESRYMGVCVLLGKKKKKRTKKEGEPLCLSMNILSAFEFCLGKTNRSKFSCVCVFAAYNKLIKCIDLS